MIYYCLRSSKACWESLGLMTIPFLIPQNWLRYKVLTRITWNEGLEFCAPFWTCPSAFLGAAFLEAFFMDTTNYGNNPQKLGPQNNFGDKGHYVCY